MQFGIFTVGDVTPDPTTGRTPTEHERIKATVAIAKKAEEVGLDVFAIGEHHNPPFIASAPTTTLAYIAAQTERLILSTATTLITTTDPVLIAEDYAKLQHLSDGRVDLMMGRGNTGPVYPWFGKDIRDGIELAIENYAPAAPALARGRRRLGGQVPHAAAGLHRPPRGRSTAYPRSSGTARSAPPRSPSRRRTTATASSPTTSSGRPSHTQRMVDLYRRRFEHYGHGTADQAIVGLGGQVVHAQEQPGRDQRVPARTSTTPRSTATARRWRTSPRETPLTVGSPQQVIERTLGFREYVGDYQRQLFLMDHAGLPLKTVLEQLDLLGEEVVPVLRREFAALKPAHVPDAPTHASLRRARARGEQRSSSSDGSSVELVETTEVAAHDPPSSSSPPASSVPSSTRILADSLAAATVDALAGAAVRTSDVEVVELRDLAHADHRQPAHRVPDRRARRRRTTRWPTADAVIAVTPVFSASYSGLFKIVLRRPRRGRPRGQAGAGRRHRRYRPPLAGPRLRDAPALRLPAADVVPTGVFAAAEDWGAADGVGHDLAHRIERAGSELRPILRMPASVVCPTLTRWHGPCRSRWSRKLRSRSRTRSIGSPPTYRRFWSSSAKPAWLRTPSCTCSASARRRSWWRPPSR